jgi:hypothetical protein
MISRAPISYDIGTRNRRAPSTRYSEPLGISEHPPARSFMGFFLQGGVPFTSGFPASLPNGQSPRGLSFIGSSDISDFSCCIFTVSSKLPHSLVAGWKIHLRRPKLNTVVSDRIMRPPPTLGYGFSGSLKVAGIWLSLISLLSEPVNCSKPLSASGTLLCCW